MVESSGTIAPLITGTPGWTSTAHNGGVPRKIPGYSGYWIPWYNGNNGGAQAWYHTGVKANMGTIKAKVSYSYSEGEDGEAAGLITKDTLSVSASDFTEKEKKKLTVLGHS